MSKQNERVDFMDFNYCAWYTLRITIIVLHTVYIIELARQQNHGSWQHLHVSNGIENLKLGFHAVMLRNK